MPSLIVFSLQDAKFFHLALELQPQQTESAFPVLVTCRLFVKRPHCWARTFPYVVCERVFKRIDHGLDTIVHVTQSLMSIEVATCPGEVFILEQSFSSCFLIKQETKRWGHKFRDLSVDLVIAFSCVSVLGK